MSPRAGLNTADVVAAGAEFLDSGETLTIAALAARLGVKAPSLYKHVDSVDDLRQRVATLVMNELGDALRDALQGRSHADAISAVFSTVGAYIAAHPGRYTTATSTPLGSDDDPLRIAAGRVIDSVRATLAGYGIPAENLDHAVRMLWCVIQGYSTLVDAGAFQWQTDLDQSVSWMIGFLDTGLRATR
jgi:AcrR family transcriptional regulator